MAWHALTIWVATVLVVPAASAEHAPLVPPAANHGCQTDRIVGRTLDGGTATAGCASLIPADANETPHPRLENAAYVVPPTGPSAAAAPTTPVAAELDDASVSTSTQVIACLALMAIVAWRRFRAIR